MQTGVRKRITIADIARESGYSKTAVSFAFNNPDRISDEACSRILETARKLNYIPDPRARNFSLGKQLTLGFLLPQDIDTCLANPYLVDVIRGLGRVCQENGYMLSIIPPLNDSLYEAVKNATVDGLVTMGYLGDGVSSLVDLIAMPLVMIDGGDDDTFLSINIDDEAAACLQLEKVLEAGHRRISIVSLPAPTLEPDANDSGIVACRMRGYRKALSAHGLDEGHVCFMQTHETTFDDGWRKAQEIISDGSTCVVTMSDIQAYGIMEAFTEMGVRVPEDISIVGFDDITGYRFPRRLTTISQPGYEKGRLAARTMFELLAGRKVSKVPLVPFSFIEGETLAGPKE